ncbi:MAG: hypothetical protein HYR51_10365 [Candidatus Rokubacteria bacterium]|nr:hypothetical protein [Candidatus Rokubacteria bacterium]
MTPPRAEEPNRQCPVCLVVLQESDEVVFVHGELLHAACAPPEPALGPTEPSAPA